MRKRGAKREVPKVKKSSRKEAHASPILTILDIQQTLLILEPVFIVAISQDGMWLSVTIQMIYSMWKQRLNGCMLTPFTGASNNNSSRGDRHKSPQSCRCRSMEASVRIFTICQSTSKEQSECSKYIRLPRLNAGRGLQDPECQAATEWESEHGRCDCKIQEVI